MTERLHTCTGERGTVACEACADTSAVPGEAAAAVDAGYAQVQCGAPCRRTASVQQVKGAHGSCACGTSWSFDGERWTMTRAGTPTLTFDANLSRVTAQGVTARGGG